MAILTVINTNGAGAGSLRQAVLDANAGADADTIVFAAGLAGQTIALTSDQIVISEDVTIDGDNKADITISGSNLDRIFSVGPGGPNGNGANNTTLSAVQFCKSATAVTAHDSNGRIVYNTATGKLCYDRDGVGGVAAVQFATLTGSPDTVTNADFFII